MSDQERNLAAALDRLGMGTASGPGGLEWVGMQIKALADAVDRLAAAIEQGGAR